MRQLHACEKRGEQQQSLRGSRFVESIENLLCELGNPLANVVRLAHFGSDDFCFFTPQPAHFESTSQNVMLLASVRMSSNLGRRGLRLIHCARRALPSRVKHHHYSIHRKFSIDIPSVGNARSERERQASTPSPRWLYPSNATLIPEPYLRARLLPSTPSNTSTEGRCVAPAQDHRS